MTSPPHTDPAALAFDALKATQYEDAAGTDGSAENSGRPLRFQTARAFADVDEPAAEPFAADSEGGAVLPAEGLVLVYGTGGAGKTTLVLDAVVHLATGKPWLELVHPARPLRIALVENEGPRAMFRAKLGRKLDAWPDAESQVIVFEEPWGGFSFRDEGHREELVRVIDEEEIDLLVVAPLARIGMQGGGTLDEIGEFVALVLDVQRRCGRALTVLIVHHENRAGQISGAWEGVPDTLLHVQPEGNGHTRVYWQKCRWSSVLHGTTTHLAWADGEGFDVEEREQITEATIAEAILSAVREYGGLSWTKLRDLNDDSGQKRIRGNDAQKGNVRDRLIQDGVLVNGATAAGHFNLWVADDPAAPRADLSTGLARASAASPDGGSDAVRATVPYVSRHGARHGTDRPGLFDDETGTT